MEWEAIPPPAQDTKNLPRTKKGPKNEKSQPNPKNSKLKKFLLISTSKDFSDFSFSTSTKAGQFNNSSAYKSHFNMKKKIHYDIQWNGKYWTLFRWNRWVNITDFKDIQTLIFYEAIEFSPTIFQYVFDVFDICREQEFHTFQASALALVQSWKYFKYIWEEQSFFCQRTSTSPTWLDLASNIVNFL